MRRLIVSLCRGAIGIAAGLLLLKYREVTLTWITMAFGAVFLISGVALAVSILIFAIRKKKADTAVDNIGEDKVTRAIAVTSTIGTIIVGIVFLAIPETFAPWLIPLMACSLIVLSLFQIGLRVSMSRMIRINWLIWALPFVVLIVGAIVLVRPSLVGTAPLAVLGWCLVVYGTIVVIDSIMTYRLTCQLKAKAEEKIAVLAEELENIEKEDAESDEPD